MSKILIKNGKALIIKNNDVVIEEINILIENGKIKKMEKNLEDSEAYIINAKNKIIMPGLINAHSHVPMSIFRETTEGCSLYEWLNEKIWPREEKLTEEDIYNASMLSFIEMIRTGCTCINDQYFMSEQIRKAAEKSKIRLVLTRTITSTDGEEGTDKRIAEFEHLYETRDKRNDLITYTVAPHSFYTCSDNCLEKVSKIALKYSLPVHVHFLESIDEIEDIKKQYGQKAIYVLKKYFNNTHNILAHGVKLDDEDIEILKTMDCSIVHNPISNLRLGCKIADTTKYIKNGLNVALGTDGQGSGSNLDMFDAMRVACLIQGGIHENEARITAKDVIKMATINGAKALKLKDKVGNLEEGKQADIIIVDTEEKLDNIKMIPNLNQIANLVYNTSGLNVETTIVNGEILMENKQIKHIDVDNIIRNVNKMNN
jgi:5-methylthioadenosine/S-adenosylhomocysteine deaminase